MLRCRTRPVTGLASPDLGDALTSWHFEGFLRDRTVCEIVELDARKLGADRALDTRQVRFLVRRHEAERIARFGRPAGTSHPVDVVLGDLGQVEVHHMAQRLDVDAARRDVRGHEHPVLTGLEAVERLGALRLGAIAVDPLGRDSVPLEQLGQTVRPVLRAREHQRVLHDATLEQLDQQRSLQLGRHGVDRLRHARGRRRTALECDRRRITKQLTRELLDRRRHGGAEE